MVNIRQDTLRGRLKAARAASLMTQAQVADHYGGRVTIVDGKESDA